MTIATCEEETNRYSPGRCMHIGRVRLGLDRAGHQSKDQVRQGTLDTISQKSVNLTLRTHFFILSSEKLARKEASSGLRPASKYVCSGLGAASRCFSSTGFSSSLRLEGLEPDMLAVGCFATVVKSTVLCGWNGRTTIADDRGNNGWSSLFVGGHKAQYENSNVRASVERDRARICGVTSDVWGSNGRGQSWGDSGVWEPANCRVCDCLHE